MSTSITRVRPWLVMALAIALLASVAPASPAAAEEPLEFRAVPSTVRADDVAPRIELRAHEWSAPFEEPATVTVEHFPSAGGDVVEIHDGPLTVHDAARASFEIGQPLVEDWYRVSVSSGGSEGDAWLAAEVPAPGEQWLDFPGASFNAGQTIFAFESEVAWFTDEVTDVRVEQDTWDGSGPVDGAQIVILDAARGQLEVPPGALQGRGYVEVAFTTTDGATYEGWFSLEEASLTLSPSHLIDDYEPPVELSFELSGGAELPAEPDLTLHDWQGPLDGAVEDVTRVSDTALTAQLVVPLAPDQYHFELETQLGTLTAWLDVSPPYLHVHPSTLLTNEPAPHGVYASAFAHDLTESATAVLVRRSDGEVTPLELTEYEVDESGVEWITWELATTPDIGLYDVVIDSGEHEFARTLRVRDPFLWLWYDHWEDEIIHGFPYGFDLDEEATLELRDRDGASVGIDSWTLDAEGDLEIVPAAPLADETHTVTATQGASTYTGKFHPGPAILDVEPPRLESDYPDVDLALTAPGGDLGPDLAAWSHHHGWRDDDPFFGRPERLSRDEVRQPVAAGLPEDRHWFEVTDGDVWWFGNLDVGDPSAEYEAWLSPWRLEPGFGTPVAITAMGWGTDWEQGVTTVRVLEDGAEVPGAVGAVTVHDEEELTFELLESLDRGDYDVEIRTGAGTALAWLTVDVLPSASLSPSTLRPTQLPIDVTLTTRHLDLLDEETEVEIWGPDWSPVDWAVTPASETSATIAVPADASLGYYEVDVYNEATGHWAWASLLIGEPRITVSPSRVVAGDNEGRRIDVEAWGFDLTDSAQIRVLDSAGTPVGGAVSDPRVPWWQRATFELGVDLPAGDYRVEVQQGDTRASAAIVSRPATDTPQVVVTGPGSTTVDAQTGEVTQRIGAFEVEDMTVVRAAECSGGGTPDQVLLRYGQNAYVMHERPDGLFETEIPAADISSVGSGGLVVAVTCGEQETEEPVGQIELFDPAGYVTDAVTGDPIEGAEVTLFHVPGWTPQASAEDVEVDETCQSNVTKPGPAGWNQPAPVGEGVAEPVGSGRMDPDENPQFTAANGYYAWDVAGGCWFVTVEKAGYVPLVSPVVGVGPDPVGEVTDLDLQLTLDDDPDTVPPAWPAEAGISVDELTTTSFTVSWPAATDDRGGEVSYLVKLDDDEPVLQAATSRAFTGLQPDTSYVVEVRPRDAAGNVGSVISELVVTPTPPGEGTLYEPMNPARLLDTRSDEGDIEGRIGADTTRSQQVAGVVGVPADATAVAINVTAVSPTASSFLTISPTGTPRPEAASLNFPPRRNVGNFIIAEVGDGGKVDIYNLKGTVDVVFDVMGYFPAGTDYRSMVPTRILDTRATTRLGPDASRDVRVAGAGTPVPGDAAAVAINMTSVAPTQNSFLTVYPTGIAQPVVSSLNFLRDQNVGNLVIAEVGEGGMATIYNLKGRVDVVFDVVGYFPAGSDLQLVEPARLLDTRNTSQGAHSVAVGPGGTIRQKVTGTDGVPENATAVAINVTAVAPTASSYLTFFPAGQDRPVAATVNFPPGLNTNNMVLAEVGEDGGIDIFNYAGNTHVIIDVVGYVPGD